MGRLIDLGANIDAQRRGRITPLHLAAKSGYVDAVRLLIQRGARTDLENSMGQTPIQSAANHLHATSVWMMQAMGVADPEKWVPPLDAAVHLGRVDVLLEVVKNDSDLETIEKRVEEAANLLHLFGHRSASDTLRSWLAVRRAREVLLEIEDYRPTGFR